MKKHLFAAYALLLVLLCLGVYGLGLRNELVFDDGRLSDTGLYYSYGGLWPIKQRLLSYGSFVWLRSLSGDSMALQRGFNVLLHMAAAAGVYALMRSLLARIASPQDSAPSGQDFPASQRAALAVGMVFFTLAPVAVYAVGYLIQRSIVMATMFSVWACWAYLQGLATASRRRAWWFLAALASYGLAVLSKEQSFLLAALSLPLYVFVARPPWKKTLSISGVALALLAVGAWLLLKAYPGLVGQVFDDTSRQLVAQLDGQRPGVAAQAFPLSVLNQAGLFFQYGLLWFLPYVGWMSIDLRPAFPLALTSVPALLGAAGYLALLVASIAAVLRRSDVWGFIGLCLLFPLILFWTEFSTVWVQDPMALYRSYLWAIPIPGLVAVLLTGWSPKPLYLLGAALAVAFAALAAERVLSMENELTVWSDAIEKQGPAAPPNAVGRYRAYMNRGAYHLGRLSADAAIRDFTMAQSRGEPTGGALLNIGIAQQSLKRHAEALRSFDQAEAMGYKDAPLYFQRGESQFALGQFAQAAESYGKALSLRQAPEVALQTHLSRADSFLRIGNYREAAQHFEVVVKARPSDPKHLVGLGMAYVGAQDGPRALDAFNRALASDGGNALAHYGRALAYATLGQGGPAQKDLDEALKLEPQNNAYQSLKQAWAAKGVRPPMGAN
jgi:tetratricopeptide (TPR) repeat protein